jgi:aminoglycoside phosphotransferase (APT) family kinase protein
VAVSELEDFIIDKGLAQPTEPQRWTTLSGGVSSDIWRVDLPGRAICVKRALDKLRVQDDWRAPPERTLHEWRWFETVRRWLPDVVPEPLAFNPERRLMAMAFLDPQSHPLWKAELLAGRVDVAFAAAVGDRLGAIHAASTSEPGLARTFATDKTFFALRLDAYLLAASRRQRSVAAQLKALADRTASRRVALVHGDVSPKNILIGPKGPVFLDAETAWWGDPAFDLAFCLNHLLLKRLVVADRDGELNESFTALTDAYLKQVTWEPATGVQQRAARLLPGLMLARVDGKSPVEYLTQQSQRDQVRAVALPLLMHAPESLEEVRVAWDRTITRDRTVQQ